MGAGSMLGGLIGGATFGWKRGRTVTVAFLGGAVVGLFPPLAMIAEMAMEGTPPSGREPWPDVLSSFLPLGAAAAWEGSWVPRIVRALSRAMHITVSDWGRAVVRAVVGGIVGTRPAGFSASRCSHCRVADGPFYSS